MKFMGIGDWGLGRLTGEGFQASTGTGNDGCC